MHKYFWEGVKGKIPHTSNSQHLGNLEALQFNQKNPQHKKKNHKIKPNNGTSCETPNYFYFLLKGRAVKARETPTLANTALFFWGKP